MTVEVGDVISNEDWRDQGLARTSEIGGDASETKGVIGSKFKGEIGEIEL